MWYDYTLIRIAEIQNTKSAVKDVEKQELLLLTKW